MRTILHINGCSPKREGKVRNGTNNEFPSDIDYIITKYSILRDIVAERRGINIFPWLLKSAGKY